MGIYKTNLTSPYFIDAPATSQESQSCICVLGGSDFAWCVTIFRLDFETGRMVRYFFGFRFIIYNVSFISKPLFTLYNYILIHHIQHLSSVHDLKSLFLLFVVKHRIKCLFDLFYFSFKLGYPLTSNNILERLTQANLLFTIGSSLLHHSTYLLNRF
jgi:hypothetical protein